MTLLRIGRGPALGSALLTVSAVLMLLCATAPAHGETITSACEFYHLRAEALGRSVVGLACRIVLPDGSWRAAFSADSLDRDGLTSEQGDGWTLIAADASRLWLNRWRGPSRPLQRDPALFMAGVAAQLDHPGTGAQRVTLRYRDPEAVLEPDASRVATGVDAPRITTLSDRLNERATGRGGAAENWWLSWRSPRHGAAEKELLIRSRRRAGALRITPIGAWRIVADPRDILLPIWPLSELMSIDKKP